MPLQTQISWQEPNLVVFLDKYDIILGTCIITWLKVRCSILAESIPVADEKFDFNELCLFGSYCVNMVSIPMCLNLSLDMWVFVTDSTRWADYDMKFEQKQDSVNREQTWRWWKFLESDV